MTRVKRIAPLVAAALLVGGLSLAGCRQEDTSTPIAPEKTVQQLLPMLGEGQSPLPTPAPDQSPLKP